MQYMQFMQFIQFMHIKQGLTVCQAHPGLLNLPRPLQEIVRVCDTGGTMTKAEQ